MDTYFVYYILKFHQHSLPVRHMESSNLRDWEVFLEYYVPVFDRRISADLSPTSNYRRSDRNEVLYSGVLLPRADFSSI